MNARSGPSQNQNRQLVYAVLILVLFVTMYPFARWLDRRKAANQLGEATLGQIDTGGFVLKLLMIGGFRGMAANMLWGQALDLQKVHEWERLKQKVDMITRLQPHFLSIWTFQSWNLAYNVSVEWDAPEDKYEWIKNGIKFVEEGVVKNDKSPDLVWDAAWYYYHKFGFADEAIILRKLFREDSDEPFKTDPMTGIVQDDNFLVGRGWFQKAIKLVRDAGAKRLTPGMEANLEYIDKPTQHKGRAGDLAFFSMPAHAQSRYAQGLEKQSIQGVPASFDEQAMEAWRQSLALWLEFGKIAWPAHNNEKELVYLDDATEPLRYAKLSDNQKYWSNRWSEQMNYRYWKSRCQAEQTRDGVDARKLFYQGTIAYKGADFLTAVSKFREGLEKWEALLKRFPSFQADELQQKDTAQLLKRYLAALRQAGLPQPKELPFQNLTKMLNEDFAPDPFDEVEMTRSNPAARAGSASPK